MTRNAHPDFLKRCRARFVEENGQWHRCVLRADGHQLHIALLHGKTFDADIRWTRPIR